MHKILILLYLRIIKKLNNLKDIISFSIERYRNKIFLIHPETGTQIKFGEFGDKLNQTISSLARLGLKTGDVLGYVSYNSVDYFQIRAACHILGIIFLGLPTNLSREDIDCFLNKTKAKVLFQDNKLHILKSEGSVSLSKDVCTLNLSSGTTQRTPKIVQLTYKNWIESLYNYILNSDEKIDTNFVFLCSLPLVTAGSTTFMPAILSGTTYVIVKENITTEGLFDYLKTYNVTHLYITPRRLIQFTEWCKENNKHTLSLRKIITGTERFSIIKLKEVIDFFGSIVHVGYGMVEVLPPITMLTPQDYTKLGSVGRPIKGVKLKILNDGRIAIKSKTLSLGYFDAPEETKSHFKDGWFYSNDYGYLDKDGFLYILGRKEDMLSEKPKRIFASEIEDMLYKLDFIKDCAVIKNNNRVGIFVVLKSQIDKEESKLKIMATIEYNIGIENIPIIIVIKDKLPINYLGKLDRPALLQEL